MGQLCSMGECIDPCMFFPHYSPEVLECPCFGPSTETLCHKEVCYPTGLCLPVPEDCKHQQIATTSSQCFCFTGDRVCQQNEYCSLTEGQCLNTTDLEACPTSPGISSDLCNCEDAFVCRPGYMCEAGQYRERPGTCPDEPFEYTGDDSCWCEEAGQECVTGEMCDRAKKSCSAPLPECPALPGSAGEGSFCSCSWPSDFTEVATVRRQVTGEKVGTWDGNTFLSNNDDLPNLVMEPNSCSLMEDDTQYGFIQDEDIVLTKDLNGSECIRSDNKGTKYEGTLSLTKSGRTCFKWNSSTVPDEHRSVGDHNFCRNHNNDDVGPWCVPSIDGEHCSPPVCEDYKVEDVCKTTTGLD